MTHDVYYKILYRICWKLYLLSAHLEIKDKQTKNLKIVVNELNFEFLMCDICASMEAFHTTKLISVCH
jgi:hypothetical protein